MKKSEFFPGAKVSLIDGMLTGTVVSVDGDMITFRDDEGFVYTYPKDELAVESFSLWPDRVEIKDRKTGRKQRGKSGIPELDLHAEKLGIRFDILLPGEILEEQLYRLKRFLEEAERKRWRKIIIIHGVGTGKLRSEVQEILRKKGWFFYDSPYHLYGQGALTAEKKKI